MNRKQVFDYLMMKKDGRNPYGSRGGYVDSARNMRGGNGGDYRGNDYRQSNSRYDNANYSQQDNARYDRNSQQYDQYNGNNGNSMRNDGHYMGQGSTYYPIEAMGTFNGYYGMPNQDYGRNDYNYNMQGRNDGHYDPVNNREVFEYDMRRNYDMRGRNDYGDYGETLTRDELKKWNKKLLKQLDEKDKNLFSKENISQRAKQMGVRMEEFNEDELLTASLMMYSDYCKALKPYVGSNIDVYIAMGKEFLTDPDASVKGGEKLAVYHDCIVSGKEEDDD